MKRRTTCAFSISNQQMLVATIWFPWAKSCYVSTQVKAASINDWSAVCWADGKFCEAPMRENLEILDRVSGRDSFASGLIYGLLTTGNPQTAVNYGAAHGALAMTTPGDTSMATLKEMEKILAGGSARVVR